MVTGLCYFVFIFYLYILSLVGDFVILSLYFDDDDNDADDDVGDDDDDDEAGAVARHT